MIRYQVVYLSHAISFNESPCRQQAQARVVWLWAHRSLTRVNGNLQRQLRRPGPPHDPRCSTFARSGPRLAALDMADADPDDPVQRGARQALNAFARGAVTDRFDCNRHVLRLNIDVTVACMNDLQSAARHLQELLPDVAGQLEL